MLYASQLRSGMAIRYEGQAYKVLVATYHPGQGKMGGVAHARLKNLSTGTLWETNFRSDLKLDDLVIEKQSMDFLYADAQHCHFMNPESFEQVEIPRALLGAQSRFLQPEMRLGIESIDGQPVSVDFPEIVELKVAETASPVHQQQDNTFKSAILENELEVLVPQFIKVGDLVRINVETLKCVERAKASAR